MSEATRILADLEQGDPAAAERLLPLVYGELRKLAERQMSAEQPGQTLQATALVHEAWLRLVDVEQAQHWNSRGHFFAAAAEAMRRILVESARSKGRLKRGGGFDRVDLDRLDLALDAPPDLMLALDDAVERLCQDDPAAGELVRLRYFAGLSLEQAAQVQGISSATAYRHWAFARVWMHAELLGSRDGE